MGGGAPSSTQSTTSYQPNPMFAGDLSGYISQIGQMTGFPGGFGAMPAGLNQQVAPLTQNQQGALSRIAQLTPQTEALSGLGAGDIAAFASGQMYNNPYLNNFYNQAATQYTNQFNTGTMPGLIAQGAQTGGLGGTGNREAQNQATYGYGQGLGTLAANMYEPAYAQGQQLQFQAGQALPGAASAMYAPYAAQYGAGAVRQAQQQNVLNTGYGNALAQIQYPFAMASEYGQALSMGLGSSGTTISQQPVIGGSKL